MSRAFVILFLALALAGLSRPASVSAIAIGDTLTIIQRPLLNIPSFVVPCDTLRIECAAPSSTTGWSARLQFASHEIALPILSASYDPATVWWTLMAQVPEAADIPLYEQYDLIVQANGGIWDRTRNAVVVIPEYREEYYFVHISDPHLPTDLYYYEAGADTDSSEIMDLRAVIADLNIINPEFVLLTGDLINEGELEDFLLKRYYTRAQRVLTEFKMPVFLTAGNHDIGGWDATPPPDGTARRDWWRFFGWKRLDSPPPGAPWRTQNYSFDYGTIHYTGLESYDNYDDFRYSIYGETSFISEQLQWLNADLAAAAGSTAKVLFHHYDFADQLNLSSLGIDLALWGHIHRDAGSITQYPYDLGTNNPGGGERAFRLVRVAQGQVYPELTMSAGSTGERLRVLYTPANDGTNDTVTASVLNAYPERFENGLLRFFMPGGAGQYQVNGGRLIQCDNAGIFSVCYVGVDIRASANQTVTIVKMPSDADDHPPLARLSLWQNSPNPFALATEFGFLLPAAGHVRLSIYSLEGREVARLVDEWRPANSYTAAWDGRGADGGRVPAGVYFARLTCAGSDVTRKVIFAR